MNVTFFIITAVLDFITTATVTATTAATITLLLRAAADGGGDNSAVGCTWCAFQYYVTSSISRRAVLFVSRTPAPVRSAEQSAYVSTYLLLYKHAVSSGHWWGVDSLDDIE